MFVTVDGIGLARQQHIAVLIQYPEERGQCVDTGIAITDAALRRA